MEEISSLKRQRDEKTQLVIEQQQEQQEESYKRQKSYKDIITLLEEEDNDPNDDLSSLISTLQEEISSSFLDRVEPGSFNPDRVQTGLSEPGSGVEEVMRHLLEASDDELGIPNNISGSSSSTEMDGCDLFDGGHVEGGDLFLPLGDGLWEFEDHEANNYYNNLLHNEVFI